MAHLLIEMDLELLLKEIVEIALGNKEPKETTYFSEIELEPAIPRWGSSKILEWLRVQSVALRLRPLELDLSSELDLACIQLVEKAEILQEIVQIREGKIMFNENVTVGQALKMMAYAKENYNPFKSTKRVSEN